MTLCVHCQKKKASRPRQLCWHCYYDKDIQQQYPVVSKYAGTIHKEGHEPTEEELEQMIAEQLPTMPEKITLPPRQMLPQVVRRNLIARGIR